jgi:hypothetical protein
MEVRVADAGVELPALSKFGWPQPWQVKLPGV